MRRPATLQGLMLLIIRVSLRGMRYYEHLYFFVVVSVMILAVPSQGYAVTTWTGLFFVEDTYVSTPMGSTNLFQGGVSLDIKPQTKKQLQARFNIRFNYTASDGISQWNISPIGNLAVDLNGEGYSVNLQHNRVATITPAAGLVETSTSRASLSLFPLDLPRVTVDYSKTETVSNGVAARTNSFSLFSDYRYRWMNFRAGYSRQVRESGSQASLSSSSLLFGLGGSYEILPATIVSGDFDVNRFSSEGTGGTGTATVGKTFRASFLSRPLEWFDVGGNFSKEITDFESDTAVVTSTSSQYADFTVSVYPLTGLRLWTTVGNRTFDDADRRRSIAYRTVAASIFNRLQENIQLGINVSRTFESDPDQGENIRDSIGINSTMDIAPRVSLRLNSNISRSESPTFVSTRAFDASGILADRAAFDDRPAGFTFFDSAHNDLYTKQSSALGDWSPPTHIEPITRLYSINNSLQLNLIPTDKTSLVLFYSANSSADKLDITGIDSQTLSVSLSYLPNRRTSYGFTGTASFPATGNASYSGTMTTSSRFSRGHQITMSYGRAVFSGKTTDAFSGTLRLQLRKRTNLEFVYSQSQLFTDEQSSFIRVRFSKNL